MSEFCTAEAKICGTVAGGSPRCLPKIDIGHESVFLGIGEFVHPPIRGVFKIEELDGFSGWKVLKVYKHPHSASFRWEASRSGRMFRVFKRDGQQVIIRYSGEDLSYRTSSSPLPPRTSTTSHHSSSTTTQRFTSATGSS